MNKYLILFTFIFGASCTQKCEQKNEHDTYVFKNASDKNIEFKIMNYFEDTIIPSKFNPKTDQLVIMPPYSSHTSKVKLKRGACIEDSYSNNEIYWLYFFDADTLKVLDWETIRTTNRGILERRMINLEYLQDNRFTLTYEE